MKKGTAENARRLIETLKQALVDGSARDPQYCHGMILMLEVELIKAKKEKTK